MRKCEVKGCNNKFLAKGCCMKHYHRLRKYGSPFGHAEFKNKNLEGKKFGRLTVISEKGKNKNKEMEWNCVCDCGNKTTPTAGCLAGGQTLSCGCLRNEASIKRNTTHGMCGHYLYEVWRGMLSRCMSKNSTSYMNYGGRGITVCPQWQHDFARFYKDMGDRPDGLTLERKDNDGDYTPENCTWATKKEQARNRRDTKNITIKGETHCVAAWAEIKGIADYTIRDRLRSGWNEIDAVLSPIKRQGQRDD